MQWLSDTKKQDGVTSEAFWYGVIGSTYVLVTIYLFFVSPQTGMSPLKNLAVAALLTIFFAVDFFILLGIARFIMRLTKHRDT